MKVMIIQIVIGAPVTITKWLVQRQEDLEIAGWVETIQTTAREISQNTEKSPGDLGELAVTQKSCGLVLMWQIPTELSSDC